MRTVLALTALLVIAACQPRSGEPGSAARAASPDARTELATARTEIDRIRAAWAEASGRDDAAAIAALYAEDGTIIDPLDYVPVQGRELIREVLTSELPGVGRLQLRSQDFYASGDLAYDYGEFTEEVTPPGAKPVTISGHYVLILRRQPDGAWKLLKKIALVSPRQLSQLSGE